MSAIFHITTSEEALTAGRLGFHEPEGFAAEGFIHCSYRQQVCGVANRLFAGRANLVLLEVHREQLPCDVLDENLEGGTERFPHIYGRLPMAAVVGVHRFPCGADGRFDLPTAIGRST